MVGAGRGKGGLLAFNHWQEERVGEGQINDGGAGPTHQREPSVLPRRVEEGKPASAAFSKYGVEESISHGEKDRCRSGKGLCMLRSPTTRRGIPRAGKRVSGETEWTLWSRVLVE